MFQNNILGISNTRIELSAKWSEFETDTVSAAPFSSVVTPDGVTLLGVVAPDNSILDRETFDLEVTLSGDILADGSSSNTIGLTPFYRTSETTASILGVAFNSEVESDSYGALLSYQPEKELSESTRLVFDFSAGVYYTSADARFSGVFSLPVVDTENFFGFRGKALAGLEFGLENGSVLTLFGGVDYWSDVAVGQRGAVVGVPASIQRDDLVEFVGGVSLSFAIAD